MPGGQKDALGSGRAGPRRRGAGPKGAENGAFFTLVAALECRRPVGSIHEGSSVLHFPPYVPLPRETPWTTSS